MNAPRTLMIAGFAATGTLLMGVSGPALADRGNDAETIRLLDECDPATFNEAFGAGACVGDGDVTLAELSESLADGGHDHWRNNPEETHVDHGEGLHVENRGGEFHTFTKVRRFSGGGCIRDLNELLGVPTRSDAFCGAALSRPTALPAGAETNVPAARLERGHNHFQCMIHPWMTTTVEVRD